MARLIEKLPDPKAASSKMTDYTLNQLKKDIGKARKKFAVHAEHNPGEYARILIISDQSEIQLSTDFVEYAIGEQFLKDRAGQLTTGLIDAIIYVKYPSFVLPQPQSYWFKCLIRKNSWHIECIKWLAYRLYLLLCAELCGRAPSDPDKDPYRALLV